MLIVRRLLVCVATTLLATPVAQSQQDACIALLQHGIYASHITNTSQQTYQEFRSNFCSWYSSYRESHSGGSAGLTIPIADIPIGFSGSLTYGEADSMSKAMCSSSFTLNTNDTAFSDASHYIDPNGAAAFNACVVAEAGGLKMQTNINDDETSAVIAVAYQAPLGAGPATVQDIETPGWTCAKPTDGGISLTDIKGQADKLTSRQYSILCKRDVFATPKVIGGQSVVSDAATIDISTTAGSFIQQFRPVLYKDPLADTAKVLASYPKGTILPYGRPSGRYTPRLASL